jgi:hypothetical protein
VGVAISRETEEEMQVLQTILTIFFTLRGAKPKTDLARDFSIPSSLIFIYFKTARLPPFSK